MKAFLLIALLATQAVQAQSTQDLLHGAEAALASSLPELVSIRHDLHRNPELSGQEVRTAGIVAEHLEALSFSVRRGIGGHGVVGVLEGGSPGPTIAFRADMDAVRSSAPDPVSYASQVPGVRHICGHDIHTVVGLAVANAAAAVKDEMAGAVMLIFQPAEETASGANAMLADGLFGDRMPDAILALHTAPYPVGTVATTAGGMMASRTNLVVEVSGPGRRETATRVAAAVDGLGTVTQALQSAAKDDVLVQRRGGPTTIRAQIMTADAATLESLPERLNRALAGIEASDVSIRPQFDLAAIAGVTNDSALVARSRAALSALAPDIIVAPITQVIPAFSEDFGSFQRHVPGMMFFLGVSNPENGIRGMPHAPDYVADDGAIAVGARTILTSLLAEMHHRQGGY
ncbi:MAG: amidohydrolase [Rhodothermales bacterium]|nr:amidohydrolase [Rhodothermales bacterium]